MKYINEPEIWVTQEETPELGTKIGVSFKLSVIREGEDEMWRRALKHLCENFLGTLKLMEKDPRAAYRPGFGITFDGRPSTTVGEGDE